MSMKEIATKIERKQLLEELDILEKFLGKGQEAVSKEEIIQELKAKEKELLEEISYLEEQEAALGGGEYDLSLFDKSILCEDSDIILRKAIDDDRELYYQLKEIGYQLPNIVDNSAIVSNSAKLDEGIFVGKKAVINANVHIKKMCIINTGAIIEHDCVIEEYSHISVGSVLCGSVSIGKQSFIGANATIIQEISVGNHVIIGAGTVVSKNVKDNTIQYGLNKKVRNTGD